MGAISYKQMEVGDIAGVVDLQRLCFPPPFPEDLLWRSEHLVRHLEIFPEGQFVALDSQSVVGSASASRISEEAWHAHRPWDETLGGFYFDSFAPCGSTMYGADISVHPSYRGQGIGRGLYECRYRAVRELGLLRYGTACRIPGYAEWAKERGSTVEEYCEAVVTGVIQDRTLSPLLRMGLSFCGVIHSYMEDEESGNAAASLEWKPPKNGGK